MEYEAIVLGATFLSAGIAHAMGDRCLIIERRPQAGYEFINALNFGRDYDKQPETEAGKELMESFRMNGAFQENRVSLFECAPHFYSLLLGKNVMLNMEIVSVEQSGDGFTVVAHGVSGYRTYKAKRVIDTRINHNMVLKKSLNVLVNNDSCEELPKSCGLKTEKWGQKGCTVIKCPVEADDGYQAARNKVFETVKCLDGFRVVMVADEFDYIFDENTPKEVDGVTLLPSTRFSNPLLAFDAGVKLGDVL